LPLHVQRQSALSGIRLSLFSMSNGNS
jgi:hypothetical protein